jgi:hypothetical protein
MSKRRAKTTRNPRSDAWKKEFQRWKVDSTIWNGWTQEQRDAHSKRKRAALDAITHAEAKGQPLPPQQPIQIQAAHTHYVPQATYQEVLMQPPPTPHGTTQQRVIATGNVQGQPPTQQQQPPPPGTFIRQMMSTTANPPAQTYVPPQAQAATQGASTVTINGAQYYRVAMAQYKYQMNSSGDANSPLVDGGANGSMISLNDAILCNISDTDFVDIGTVDSEHTIEKLPMGFAATKIPTHVPGQYIIGSLDRQPSTIRLTIPFFRLIKCVLQAMRSTMFLFVWEASSEL